MSPLGQLFTLDEASQFLRLGPTVVAKHARNGILHGAFIGRRWRFTPEDLTRFLQESAITSTTRKAA